MEQAREGKEDLGAVFLNRRLPTVWEVRKRGKKREVSTGIWPVQDSLHGE